MKENRFLRFWSAYKESILLLCAVGLYVLGMYLLHIPCPIKLLTGVSCPGCGMTRAYASLLRLDFSAAFAYHPLWPLIPILLVLLPIFHRKNFRLAFNLTIWGFVIAMIALYLYRIFILHDPILSASPADGLIGRAIRGIIALFHPE